MTTFASSATLPVADGAGTVGYVVWNIDGTAVVVPHTTAGVSQIYDGIDYGIYSAAIMVPDNITGCVVIWDDGADTAISFPFRLVPAGDLEETTTTVEANNLSVTWIMRRVYGRVGSQKIIPKASGEAPLMYAEVSRILNGGTTVGNVGDIDITAPGMVAGGIGKLGGALIYFYLTGGTIPEDGQPVDVVISFLDSAGRPVECRGAVLVI